MKIVDAFNWNFNDVAMRARDFKSQGFDAVQISPIQWCKEGNDWYLLFQNYDIQTIGNRLGTEQEWIKCCEELHNAGLKVITSIQLRHVAGKDNGECKPHEKVPYHIAKHCKGVDWYNNDKDRHQVTEGNWGLPRLDYESDELWEDEYIPFLDTVFCHSDYVRIDEGKHIGLPSEGYKFWSRFYNIFGKRAIAECINEREDILNEYAKYCLVLTEEGTKCPKGTVRFVESHDTYLNDWGYTKHLSDWEILNRFEGICRAHHNVMFYIRPFNNTVFSSRMYDILHNPCNRC